MKTIESIKHLKQVISFSIQEAFFNYSLTVDPNGNYSIPLLERYKIIEEIIEDSKKIDLRRKEKQNNNE